MHVELKLDTRKANKDGRYPVKVYLSESRRTRMVATGIYADKGRFDGIRGELMGQGNKRANEKLAMILTRSRVETEGMGLAEAVAAVRRVCDYDGSMSETFEQFWQRCAESPLLKSGTRATYRTTMLHIRRYCDVSTLRLQDIDAKWIRGLEESMAETLSLNTRTSNLSRLRRVVRLALDEGVIERDPFRGIRLRTEETRKRCLSLEELARVRDIPLNGFSEFARDMFMLSFYLIGMNPVDMYHAEPVRNGRLQYRRMKTGRLYDIKIEPEAQALIDKYRGTDRLLCLSERYARPNSMMTSVGLSLKRRVDGRLSLYWARHTWATLAASIDIPMDVISMSLGHSFGLKVTNVYVRHDLSKVDKANRAVLDLLRSQPARV